MNILILLSIIAYSLESLEAISVFGHSLTPFDVVTIFMFVLFIKKIVWDGVELKIAQNPALLFYFFFHIAVVLSGFIPLFKGETPQIVQFLKTFSHFNLTVLFATVCGLYEIKNEVWLKSIKLWLIFGLFINIFGVYQILARAYDLPFAWLSFTNSAFTFRGKAGNLEDLTQLSLQYANFFRATSIYPEPSTLATTNVINLSFLLIPILTRTKPFFKSRAFTNLLIIVSLITSLTTFSLTGLLGIFIVFGALLLVEFRKVFKPFLITVLIATFLLVVSDNIIEKYTETSVIELFSNRVLTLTGIEKDHTKVMMGESFYWRASNLEMSFEGGLKSPIIGNGLGLTYYATNKNIVFSDSAIASIFCEMGIIGVLIFTGLSLSLLYYAFRYYLLARKTVNPDEDNKLYVVLPFLILFFIEINYLTANQLVNMSMWLFMSMFISLVNNKLIESNKYYSLRLIKTPFKEIFAKSINISASILKK